MLAKITLSPGLSPFALCFGSAAGVGWDAARTGARREGWREGAPLGCSAPAGTWGQTRTPPPAWDPPSCSPFLTALEEAGHDVELPKVLGHENCPSSVHGSEAGGGLVGWRSGREGDRSLELVPKARPSPRGGWCGKREVALVWGWT